MGRAPEYLRPPIDWGDPTGTRYTIREVVALTEVPSSSIHHYRRLGLVPEPERTAPNRFLYDDRHITALGIVRSLRQRGRTLAEIHRALPELLVADERSIGAAIDAYLVAHVSADSPKVALVEAAIGAFADQGYRDVSVASLCERAGVAKGTFYRHFDSKDSLFLAAAGAVVERAIVDFTAEVAAGTATNDPPAFARHLRRGLPVLFELAKRSIQESGSTVHAAATMFADLAERLGRVVGEGDDPAQVGGVVVVLAVVEIFTELLETEIPESS